MRLYSRTGAEKLTVVTRIEEDNSCEVEVSLTDNYGYVVCSARGKARWNPIDHFDPEIGAGIAFGRALTKFGRKYANLRQALSETEGQHRARLRMQRRNALLNASINEMLVQMTGKPKVRKERVQNGPQEPTMAPVATEVVEVTPDTKKASTKSK